MSLEVYAKYFDPAKQRTVISVVDSDPAVFVRFEADFEGDISAETDEQLLERAVTWFTNKYIQEYAQQKLDSKVREFEGMIEQMKHAIEESKLANQENRELVKTVTLTLNELVMSNYEEEEGTENEEDPTTEEN